jgi:hypothetical protein
MVSCNSPVEMQLLQSNVNGNVDGNGKNAHGDMKRKKVCSIMRWCGQYFEKS